MTANEALLWSGIVVTLAGWATCYVRWPKLDLIDFFVLGVMLFFGVYSVVNSQLTDVNSYDPYVIIAAHLLVLMATAAVRTFGYMIPVRVRRALEFKSLLELARMVSGTSLMVLIAVSCAFSIFGLVKYGIVGAGVSDELARSELPYWFTSLKQVEYAGTLAGLLVCTTVRVCYRSGTVRVGWTLAMLLILVLLAIEGRRIACLSLLTVAVIYSKARHINPFRPGRLLLAAPFGAVILLMYSNVFQTYRESFGMLALKGWFGSQDSLADALASNDATMANVSQREGTWTYPYLVVEEESDNGPLKGALFIQAAKNLIPSGLQEHKEFKDPDELLEELYGLPQGDLATNIFGLTYADFGVAGILVLVVIVCFTAAAIGFMINATGRFPIVGVLVFGMGVQAMFMAEGQYENYLVLLRTLAVLAVVLMLDGLQREWAAARLFLADGEKELTRLSRADELLHRTPHLVAAIRRFLPADGDASIIDLGAGFGAFIHTARTLGYRNIEGCDRALERVNSAAAFGVNSIVHGDLFDVLERQEDGSRDVVVSFDVLEHLNKPQVVHCAQQVYRVLRPGGRWLIHTVNGESPWFGRVRYGDFTHELVFTHHSLHEVLTAAGFSRTDFHEDAPAVHGALSAVRWILWRMLCAGLRLRMTIETGSFDRAAIFTQNLFAVAFR